MNMRQGALYAACHNGFGKQNGGIHMLLTIFLAIVFCAAMAMMLFSAVAFIQDNKFFSSSKASC